MKLCAEGLDVEYELLQPVTDERQLRIYNQINEIDGMMEENRLKIEEINRELERLTNHADGLDYTVAVASGIIAGLIDSFFVGEFDLSRGKKWGSDKVNEFVKKVAKSTGCKKDDLESAIIHLEDKFHMASDSSYGELGGSRQHHLRDFAHHPSIVGLIFSMITQFTEKAYGTDAKGKFIIVEVKNKLFIGKDIPQKILFGTVFWFFHLVSDMAGSRSTPGAGTGIPGLILSLAKELSCLPFFRNIKIGDTEFSVWISKLFNGTLLGKRDGNGKLISAEPFDLRAEIGVAYELGRQAIPVIINEAVVRAFYFIRRLYAEFKEKEIKSFKELKLIEWKNVVPAKNRTITRMLTISTGTFVACDMADAAIRSGGTAAGFLLRVNFVGVGRFVVAVGVDAKMGIEKSKNRNERIALCSRQLHLLNAKVAYKQADMWIAAEDTGKAIDELMSIAENSMAFCADSIDEIEENLNKIDSYMDSIREHNPELIDEISDVLKWG